MIFEQDYNYMNEMSTKQQSSKKRLLDYHIPNVITTARETKTTNFFFDKRIKKHVSTGSLIHQGYGSDYIEGKNPSHKISNKLHSILGIKRDESNSRFNESSSAKTVCKIQPSKSRKVKKQHPIESLVVSDHSLIDTNTLRNMQSTQNTPAQKNITQSSTGLNLEIPNNKWYSSMPDSANEGLTLDKIKKSANLFSAGVIKNKEQLKSQIKQRQTRGIQSTTSSMFSNRNSPSKNDKYARQQPFLSLSSLNARKKSLENGELFQVPKNQYPNSEQPVMGIAGQKMQLQNYIPEHILLQEENRLFGGSISGQQAQQGIQKGITKAVGITPPDDKHKHIKVFLKQIPKQADQFYYNNEPKSYFVMPKSLNHKTPQLNVNNKNSNFEAIIREAARDNAEIIIDSNVDNSKSLERLVGILEQARVQEQQTTSKFLRQIQRVEPAIQSQPSQSRLYNHVKSTSSNGNTVYLNNDSESEQPESFSTHITPKKQKFIVKISTPMPQRIKISHVPNMNLVRQTEFQALEGIQSQIQVPVSWPLQYSDFSRYQAGGSSKQDKDYRYTRQQAANIQQQTYYEPWVDQHKQGGEGVWYETFDQSNNYS